MHLKEALDILSKHNAWRRGDDSVAMGDSAQLGKAIEIACLVLQEQIEMNSKIMRGGGFGEWVDNFDKGNCPGCMQPVDTRDFKDELSIKEFTLSGLCQKCQDEFFNEDEDNGE